MVTHATYCMCIAISVNTAPIQYSGKWDTVQFIMTSSGNKTLMKVHKQHVTVSLYIIILAYMIIMVLIPIILLNYLNYDKLYGVVRIVCFILVHLHSCASFFFFFFEVQHRQFALQMIYCFMILFLYSQTVVLR